MNLKHIDKVLEEFGAYAVESAQLELGTTRKIRGRNVRRVASGDLQKSLFSTVFTREGKKVVGFGAKGKANEYAGYIHEGVNGTLKKHNSQFSFTERHVAIPPILAWLKTKRIQPRRKAVGKTGGRKFKPNVSAGGKDNLLALAFAVATSIAQNGIVPLPFMKLGVERSLRKYDKKILEALGKDVFDNLEI